jgi:hypothetical protein
MRGAKGLLVIFKGCNHFFKSFLIRHGLKIWKLLLNHSTVQKYRGAFRWTLTQVKKSNWFCQQFPVFLHILGFAFGPVLHHKTGMIEWHNVAEKAHFLI